MAEGAPPLNRGRPNNMAAAAAAVAAAAVVELEEVPTVEADSNWQAQIGWPNWILYLDIIIFI